MLLNVHVLFMPVGSGRAASAPHAGSSKPFSRPGPPDFFWFLGLGCNYKLFITVCDLRPEPSECFTHQPRRGEGKLLSVKSVGSVEALTRCCCCCCCSQAADAVHTKQTLPDRVVYTLSVQRAAPPDGGAYECSVTEELSGEVRAGSAAVAVLGKPRPLPPPSENYF